MKDVESLLGDLGRMARNEARPEVDVRSRVMSSIAAQPSVARLDLVPLVFSGVAVAVAAMLVISFLPSAETMLDPWASYFSH